MDQKEPLVSIVISNWNSIDFLKNCLASLLQTNYKTFEIIFMDNASTDGAVEFIEETYSDDVRIRLIKKDENIGLTKLFNEGFTYTKGKYVVFMHSDTTVDPDWLKPLVSSMENDLNVGVAQGKLLSMEDDNTIFSVGCIPDYLGYPQKVIGRFEEDKGQYSSSFEIFNTLDSCMIVRRNVVEVVGLFDPMFKWFREEEDFCWRVRLRGYKIIYVPESVIWHKSSIIFSKNAVDATFNRFKNYLSMLLKNYGKKNLIKYFPIAFTMVLLRVFIGELIILRSPKQFFAGLKGIFWIFPNIGYIYNQRSFVQNTIRIVPDSEIEKLMLKPNISVYFGQLYFLKKLLS